MKNKPAVIKLGNFTVEYREGSLKRWEVMENGGFRGHFESQSEAIGFVESMEMGGPWRMA